MKKLLIVLLAVTMLSITPAIIQILTLNKNGNFENYSRFQKMENNKTNFNWWSLVFPIQTETQVAINDTANFYCKVVYPVAPKFKMIEPGDSSAEKFIAKRIATVIADSVRKIFNLKFDYDKQSLAVRKYQNPETLIPEKPKIFISLLGTASPEALKYGLKNSLIPGNVEDENCDLAQKRLERTNILLQKELTKLGINFFQVTSLQSEELQLRADNSIDSVLKNPAILDSMRFVKANVIIPYQKIEITPVLSPVLLPLWILLFFGLFAFSLMSKEKRTDILAALMLILIGIALIAIIILYPFWVLLILGIIYLIVYLIFLISYPIRFKKLFIWLWNLIKKIPWLLMLILLGIYWSIVILVGIIFFICYLLFWGLFYTGIILLLILGIILVIIINIWDWFLSRTLCQKILIIHFLLDLLVFILWATGVLHISF